MRASYRGVVGAINPTRGASGLREFLRLLPDGIGVIPAFLNVREQVESEFRAAFDATEAKVAELAELKVDLVHPIGAPLFMLQGFAGEERIVKGWEDRYGVPIVTSPQTQVEAMRALDIHHLVGLTYIRGEINQAFARYLRDAGFDVLTMECMPGSFVQSVEIPWQEVYVHAKRLFLSHPDADGIYLLGSGWQILDVIEELEGDLGAPVSHPVTARVWAIQRRLHVRQPLFGYGRLLETLP